MKNLLSALKDIWVLAAPYFMTKDKVTLNLPFGRNILMQGRWIAFILLITILVINVAQVYLQVLFNEWSVPFYTSLQKKDAIVFWQQLYYFGYLAFIHITTAVSEIYLTLLLTIHWREWMTNKLTETWLTNHAHYRLSLFGSSDNPDQRIAEDIRLFVSNTLDIFVRLFSTILSLSSFAVILWGLSKNFPLNLGGFELNSVPGYLFWVIFIYVAFGTITTHLIGRSLVKIDFMRQKTEADFRFSLARIREYGEPIGLLNGEAREKTSLKDKFTAFVTVYNNYMGVRKNLSIFTNFFGQASVMFPFLLCSSAYFAAGGTMEYGQLQQVARAFGTVEANLNIFITIYTQLAEYRATINRLTTFNTAITQAQNEGEGFARSAGTIAFKDVTVTLPTGEAMVKAEGLQFTKGQHLLVTGPSGSGKSTLFRALSGLWPYGKGEITTPQSLMLIPQKPYLPLGTLKEALLYPNLSGTVSDARLLQVLKAVQLDKYGTALNETKPWHIILSGGEQQKLSLARAMLQQPEWLLLDEATAAMDEPTEGQLYAALKSELPNTTIVSIGHRSTLVNYHDKRIQLVKTGECFSAQEAPLMMMKGA